MTIRKAIELADAVKPNAFDDEVKLEWLNALEGRIAADVFLIPSKRLSRLRYKYPQHIDKKLMVGYPHDDIYVLWLQARIDEANGEYGKYQNTMQLYNEHYGNFVRWFARTYEPAQK